MLVSGDSQALRFPGQFAPKSKLVNMTLADSLPGTFTLQSEMARGTFVPPRSIRP